MTMKGTSEYYVKGGPTELPALLESLRRKIFVHRVRVHEFMQDYDKLRTGHISKDHFRSALNAVGFKLKDSDFEMLVDAFAFPPSLTFPNHVRWRDFSDYLDQVFTTKGLEKTPTVTPAGPNRPPTGSLLPFSVPLTTKLHPKNDEAEFHVLGQVLDRFRERASERRVILKPSFMDFDKHHIGRITQQQFRRVLTKLSFECSEAEMKAIINYYADAADGDVNYVAFVYDIVPRGILEGALGTTPWQPTDKRVFNTEFLGDWNDTRNPNPPPFATFVSERQRADLELLLVKLRNLATRDRVRFKDFFVDYDKGALYGPVLRKRMIPAAKFRTGISHAVKAQLSPAELDLLCEAFAASANPEEGAARDMVDYASFLQAIEQPFEATGLLELEKTPSHVPRDYEPIDFTASLSPDDEERTHALLERMAERVKVRHMLCKPFFQDFDANYMSTSSLKSRHTGAHSSYRGRVTRSQFRRVLGNYGFELSLEEFDLLERKFKSFDFPEMVDYRLFCAAVDDSYGMFKNSVHGGM
eukprot:tig00021350_g20651.t1